MSASIWYHPTGARAAVEIDLGSNVTDIEITPDIDFAAVESLNGQATTSLFRQRLAVRIELANFTSADLWRKLLTLESHLNAGLTIGFAQNKAKAYAGYSVGARPPDGLATLNTSGNTWAYYASAALAASDPVCIWGGSPEGQLEYTTLYAVSGTKFVLNDALRYNYQQGHVMLRHSDYWPALRRKIDDRSPIVRSSLRRLTYTLDFELVEDVDLLARAASWAPGALATTTAGRGLSADQLARRAGLGTALPSGRP